MESIRFYFTLQYRFLNRQLSEFGLHPVIGYLLISVLFVTLSYYLFSIIEYAAFIYAFLALALTSIPGEINRSRFLKISFSKPDFRNIRLIENLLWVFPFFIFLLFKHEFYIGIGLLAASALLSFVHFNFTVNKALPTPFFKFPFEYTVGFRSIFYIFGFAYFLMVMSVLHSNPNLGRFSLGLILLACIPFYTTPENGFYVWIHSMSPDQFILHKLRISILYSTLLCIPVIAGLLFFYTDNYKYVIAIYLLGQLYLLATMLGKYAFFPAPVNVPQWIILGFSFVFPPLLLLIIPYFYNKARKQLKSVLE